MSKRSQRGFTLLELLVTLVIIGILITFVAVSFTTNSYKHDIRIEAVQLARKVELIRRVATTHNTTWGLSISRTSYRFLEFEPIEKKWIYSEDRRFRNHNLPDNIYLQFEGDFDIPTLNDALEEHEPEMTIFPGGEMTPFLIHCKHEYSEHIHVLRTDGLNEVEVMSEAELIERDSLEEPID